MGRIVGAVLVGGLVAGGIVGALMVKSAIEEPLAFCPGTSETDTPQDDSELDARTEPRTTAGPHGVAMFDVSTTSDGDYYMHDQDYELTAAVPAWESNDGKVQVLVCQYETRLEDQIRICDGYNIPSTIPVVAVRYHYKVYEASTKKLLDKFDLQGIPPEVCPETVTYRGSPEIAAELDIEELVERLRPFVEMRG